MAARERLVVALVRGLHGLNGAVRVEVLTDHPEARFASGGTLYREGDQRPLTLVSAAPDSPGWLLRFAEVADRAAAEGLRGRYLESEVASGEEPGDGEFYWHEVIGAVVRDLAGRELGRVVDVYRAGGVDAYVVRGVPYGEFDLPAVRAFIPVFDPRGEGIVVDTDRLELVPAKPPRPPREARPRKAAGSGNPGR